MSSLVGGGPTVNIPDIPDIPGIPREQIERAMRSGRPLCRRCNEDVRGHRVEFNHDRSTVTISGTCRCGFQTHTVPAVMPRVS